MLSLPLTPFLLEPKYWLKKTIHKGISEPCSSGLLHYFGLSGLELVNNSFPVVSRKFSSVFCMLNQSQVEGKVQA